MADNLLVAIKNGDKAAFDKLLEKYEPLILSECAKVLVKFPDFKEDEEEMRQEGRLALYKAVMAYEENGDVTFGLYAKICIKNRLVSYLRKLRTARRRAAKIAAAKPNSDSSSSAEVFFWALEKSEKLKKILDEEASQYEKKVFLMYLKKTPYVQIADALGKSVKSVDNAITRVKAKIKKRLQGPDN